MSWFFIFFFNDTATTEIYTLSLHDALPICHPTPEMRAATARFSAELIAATFGIRSPRGDRKSTRLNSSHQIISYAVFCLKKKKVQELKNVNTRSKRNCRYYPSDCSEAE